MDAPLSIAVEGWLLSCHARSLSQNTIDDYTRTLKKFSAHLGLDPVIRSITTRQLQEFLISQPVGKKSKLNYYIGLSALWTWAIKEDLVDTHRVRAMEAPRAEIRELDPFSPEDVKVLFHELNRPIPYYQRIRAAAMLLLDTGLRASEICSLQISDLHLKEGYAIVLGKGAKERRVEFGPRTSQAIWRYLASRGKIQPDDPFLASRTGRRMGRDELANRLRSVGQRAGVDGCHPHRFRHTFAVMFLRNGGSSLALQKLLGHSTMEMVKRYVKFSEVDLAQAHRRASPVENLRL